MKKPSLVLNLKAALAFAEAADLSGHTQAEVIGFNWDVIKPMLDDAVKQARIAEEGNAHLANLLEWAIGNRGHSDGNPYGIEEVRQSLEYLAECDGQKRADYLKADTLFRATYVLRDRCQCFDMRCMHSGDGQCPSKAMVTLYRVDMEDESGTRFCGHCADDAGEAGLFANRADSNYARQNLEG